MQVEICDECVDEVVAEAIKQQYEIKLDELKKVLETDESTGIHSFNPDEEIFGLIDDLEHLWKTFLYYGGQSIKSWTKLLENKGKEYYEIKGNESELKQKIKDLTVEKMAIKEELDTLKGKVKGLLEV